MLLTSEKQAVGLKAKLFRGFGDPSRLAILMALLEGPCTVGEIVEQTGLSQPNVSNHLNCLKDCGLAVNEQSGRFVIYRLSDDRVAELIEVAGSLLADIARGVYECTRYNLPKGQETSSDS